MLLVAPSCSTSVGAVTFSALLEENFLLRILYDINSFACRRTADDALLNTRIIMNYTAPWYFYRPRCSGEFERREQRNSEGVFC